MSDGYVLAGYGITLGTLGLYALRVLRRGRSLSRSLPTTGSGGGPLLGDGQPGRPGEGG
ncbi:MAG: hypothetical protein ACT4PX_10950 [Actinomycetota bacterium]